MFAVSTDFTVTLDVDLGQRLGSMGPHRGNGRHQSNIAYTWRIGIAIVPHTIAVAIRLSASGRAEHDMNRRTTFFMMSGKEGGSHTCKVSSVCPSGTWN